MTGDPPSREPNVADAWKGLIARTLTERKNISATDRVSWHAEAQLYVSDVCVIVLGSSSVWRVGDLLVVEVSVNSSKPEGLSGPGPLRGASRVKHVGFAKTDEDELTQMMEHVERLAAVNATGLLQETVMRMVGGCLPEVGTEGVELAYRKALVRSVTDT
jgi:hypothetical protein